MEGCRQRSGGGLSPPLCRRSIAACIRSFVGLLLFRFLGLLDLRSLCLLGLRPLCLLGLRSLCLLGIRSLSLQILPIWVPVYGNEGFDFRHSAVCGLQGCAGLEKKALEGRAVTEERADAVFGLLKGSGKGRSQGG